MRDLSLFLLLASAAVPVHAAPDNEPGSSRERGSKSEQSESRSQGSENRSERAARQQSENRSDRAVTRQESQQADERRYGAQRSERAQPADQGTTTSIRERILERRQQAASARSDENDAVRPVRARDRDAVDEGKATLRPRERQVRTIPETRPRVTQPSAEERRTFTERRRRDYRDGNYRRWTNNWRHERRYDWRDYRNRHRSLFRLGFYYDPFGWNYRRWSIGSFLWPSYYGSSYWLNDPWHYRLPPAYGPYRWVRYWDDALLVNIYTGQVVDVLHNFFW